MFLVTGYWLLAAGYFFKHFSNLKDKACLVSSNIFKPQTNTLFSYSPFLLFSYSHFLLFLSSPSAYLLPTSYFLLPAFFLLFSPSPSALCHSAYLPPTIYFLLSSSSHLLLFSSSPFLIFSSSPLLPLPNTSFKTYLQQLLGFNSKFHRKFIKDFFCISVHYQTYSIFR